MIPSILLLQRPFWVIKLAMRFPKTLTFTCLLTVGTSVGFSQTADLQEKALRALRESIAADESHPKAAQSHSQPAATNQNQAPSSQDKIDAAQKALERMEGTSSGAASSKAISEERERKARGALDELRRAGEQPKPVKQSGAPLTDTEEQKARTVLTQSYSGSTAPGGGSTLTPDQEAKARAALERLEGPGVATTSSPAAVAPVEPPAAQPPQVVPAVAATAPSTQAPAATAPSQAAPSTATTASAQVPIAVPPAEMNRNQKLQQILDLYIADKISPREYHEKRAAILAGN